MERFVKEYYSYRVREMKQSEMIGEIEFKHKQLKYRKAIEAYEKGIISNRECMRILCGIYDNDYINWIAKG